MTDIHDNNEWPAPVAQRRPAVSPTRRTPPVNARSGAARPRREAHPARSARILSTGLAATATFGLISGYAYAAKSGAADTGNVGGTTPTVVAPGTVDSSGAVTPAIAAQSQPQTQSQSQPQVQATQPPAVVIEVPAPTPAAPASGGGGGSGQPSSGSR